MLAITTKWGNIFGTTNLTTIQNACVAVQRVDYMDFTNVFC
jgi:hypothetical protein